MSPLGRGNGLGGKSNTPGPSEAREGILPFRRSFFTVLEIGLFPQGLLAEDILVLYIRCIWTIYL